MRSGEAKRLEWVNVDAEENLVTLNDPEKRSKQRMWNRSISVVVDERPDVCEEYSIEYYPTVILFKKGKVHGRLDAELGVGLDKKQLKAFTEKS